MPKIDTIGIWSDTSGDLWRRAGLVAVANPREFAENLHEPVPISEGLRDDDALVYLSIKGLLQRKATTRGFLVYDVDCETGAGYLMDGEAIAHDPHKWVNDRIGSMWSRLHVHEFTLGEFDDDPNGLSRVDTYIDACYGTASD